MSNSGSGGMIYFRNWGEGRVSAKAVRKFSLNIKVLCIIYIIKISRIPSANAVTIILRMPVDILQELPRRIGVRMGKLKIGCGNSHPYYVLRYLTCPMRDYSCK